MPLPQLLRDEPVRRHPLAGLRLFDRAVWGGPTAGDRLSQSVAPHATDRNSHRRTRLSAIVDRHLPALPDHPVTFPLPRATSPGRRERYGTRHRTQ